VIDIKKVIYCGRMEEGRIVIGNETITGRNGCPVEVSNEAFDVLVGLKDWKGIYKEKVNK